MRKPTASGHRTSQNMKKAICSASQTAWRTNTLASDEPLDGAVQLLDLGAAAAGADRLRDAVLGVVRKKLQRDAVERSFGGADLGQDVDAVSIVRDHLLDSPDLPFDPPQSRLNLRLVGGVPGHRVRDYTPRGYARETFSCSKC